MATIKKRSPSYMTPSEFQTVLNELWPGPSQVTRAAKFFHRDLRTVRRWKNKHLPIPPEAAMLMRVMITQGLLPDTVERFAAPHKKGA